MSEDCDTCRHKRRIQGTNPWKSYDNPPLGCYHPERPKGIVIEDYNCNDWEEE